MGELKIRTRATGASAVLPPGGLPSVTTPTGGAVDVVTSVSAPGFNPLDLLYASLAACMVLSARIAASRLGVADRL
ncbi:MAG: OsmC family peroxiredoxin, partial [Mesorhizobium sp.]